MLQAFSFITLYPKTCCLYSLKTLNISEGVKTSHFQTMDGGLIQGRTGKCSAVSGEGSGKYAH